MLKNIVFICCLFTLASCGGGDEKKPDGGGGAPAPTQARQLTGVGYKGMIGSVLATGTCDFEDNTNVGGTLNMSCIFQSGQLTYSFPGQMAGATTGYADMTETPTGSRMQIRIDWDEANYPPSGFLLTVNPFASATQYRFTRN